MSTSIICKKWAFSHGTCFGLSVIIQFVSSNAVIPVVCDRCNLKCLFSSKRVGSKLVAQYEKYFFDFVNKKKKQIFDLRLKNKKSDLEVILKLIESYVNIYK